MNIQNTQQTWDQIARESQKLPQGNWALWMILAGRGFGKTRTGAETIMQLVESGEYKRIAIIGKNIREAKDIMVEGHSGLLSTTYSSSSPIDYDDDDQIKSKKKYKYFSSKNKIKWENGAVAYILGADNYESLRGLQFDLVWVDEFAKFRDPESVWEQIMFTLRIGDDPKCIMTTTPKPLEILRTLSKLNSTFLTKGSTFENQENLSPRFIETMKTTYTNTRTGDQELFGEILLDKTNTLWKKEDIIYREVSRNQLQKVVIGVDPSVTCSETSDETGIIIAGLGYDEKIYVIDDLSGKYKPQDWAKIICRAYKDFRASYIVAETNNGGDLVKEVISTIYPNIPFRGQKAIKGKLERAEPISMLYEAQRVFHTTVFQKLEEQMCGLSHDEPPKKSPDRVDALVWAINELKDIEPCRITII